MIIKTQKVKLISLAIVLVLVAGGFAIQSWRSRPTADEPPTDGEQYDYEPVRNPRLIALYDSKSHSDDPDISLAVVFDPPLDADGQPHSLDYQVSLKHQFDPNEPALAFRDGPDFDPISHVEGTYIDGIPDNFSIDLAAPELPDFSELPWYTNSGSLYLLNIGPSTILTDDSIYTFKIQALAPETNRRSKPTYLQVSGYEILDAGGQGTPITQLPAKVSYRLDQLGGAI